LNLEQKTRPKTGLKRKKYGYDDLKNVYINLYLDEVFSF
jgi:hypothetical protein